MVFTLHMDTEWNVYVIEYASSHEPWVGLVKGMQDDGMVDLPFSFVLATCGERRVLVDCGFMQSGSEAEFPLKFEVGRWISPLRMLHELDIGPNDVDDIVVTHAHFDHMGSIGEFPRARLHVQKSELLPWYEAIALPERFGHLTKIVDPANLRAALEASIEHRVVLLDGDTDDVLPGIHVRMGAGHTIGQQFVVVDTAAGQKIVSGDCLYTTRQLRGHRGDGVYVPLNNAVGSVWDQLRTLDRIDAALAGDPSNLIILHDVDRWAGHPIVAERDGFRIIRVA